MAKPVKNIWVFGGTGFIGSALVDHLSLNPSNKLHLLLHHRSATPKLERFISVQDDLSRFDFNWFEKYKPDYIFHLARLAGSQSFTRWLAARKGLEANARLLAYLEQMDPQPTVVYVSGSLVYGNQSNEQLAYESAAINPVAYARHYIKAEQPWMTASSIDGKHFKIARPGWIIGSDSWFKVFYWNYYQKTGRVPLYGPGDQLMSLIHLEDLAQLIAMIPNADSAIFNLFAGAAIRQGEFSELMAQQLGASIHQFSALEIRKEWGRTTAEALLSSIPIATNNQALLDQYTIQYPTADVMLTRTIGLLKSE